MLAPKGRQVLGRGAGVRGALTLSYMEPLRGGPARRPAPPQHRTVGLHVNGRHHDRARLGERDMLSAARGCLALFRGDLLYVVAACFILPCCALFLLYFALFHLILPHFTSLSLSFYRRAPPAKTPTTPLR